MGDQENLFVPALVPNLLPSYFFFSFSHNPKLTHLFSNHEQQNINDPYSPSYTKAFLPIAERLTSLADKKATTGTTAAAKEASALYLRACAVYRIARFPYITAFPEVNDAVKWCVPQGRFRFPPRCRLWPPSGVSRESQAAANAWWNVGEHGRPRRRHT